MGRGTLSLLVVLCISFSLLPHPTLLQMGAPDETDASVVEGVAPTTAIPDLAGLLSSLGGSFTENLGQLANPDVRFYAMGDPLSVGLMPTGMAFMLQKSMTIPKGVRGQSQTSEVVAFSMELVGCNAVNPRGTGVLGHRSNFFLGSDPDGWATGARSFSEVLYEGIYDGIDLRFYFTEGMLKYDFRLDAGVDPARIALRYQGVSGLGIDPSTGDLVLLTALGAVRDARPVAYQVGADGPVEVGMRYKPLDACTVAYEPLGRYRCDLPMVIDPGLEYATFFGGSDFDIPNQLAVDAQENAVVMGHTKSLDFPTTSGAYCTTYQADYDLLVAKLDPTLSRIIFSTLIGGNGDDWGSSLTVAPDGTIYGAGEVNSTNLPVPGSPYRGTNNTGRDAYLFRLSGDGDELLSGTYLGGSYYDQPDVLLVDAGGDVHVVGITDSEDLPVTPGAYCSTCLSTYGLNEVTNLFLACLDGSLSTLNYCTYVCVVGEELYAFIHVSACMDSSGNIYIGGGVGNPAEHKYNFPATEGAFCDTYQGYWNDAFVMKLDHDGSRLLSATLFGGEWADQINGIAVSGDGRVYATGYTESDLPTTPGTPYPTWRGDYDTFIVAFDSDLSKVELCTYLGGYDFETGVGLKYHSARDRLYLNGYTQSPDFPITPGCFDRTVRGGRDPFLTVFDASDLSIEYSSLIGSSDADGVIVNGLAVNASGVAYVMLIGDYYDFPTVDGAYCRTICGAVDAYLCAIDPRPCTEGPPPPGGLRAELVDSRHVRLSWGMPSNKGNRVIGTRVYRGTSPDAPALLGNGLANDTYLDLDPPPGKLYYYWVTAVGTVMEGPLGDPVAIPIIGPPSAPRGLAATTGDGTVNLTWSAPSDAGQGMISGYIVYRGTDLTMLDRIATLGNLTSYIDPEVAVGTTYHYAVSAVNQKSEGALCAPISVAPLAPASPPRNLEAVEGDGRVELYWIAPAKTGGTPLLGYRVYGGLATEPPSLLAEKGPRDLNHLMTGLTNGRTYLYTVMAVTAVGEGMATPAVTAVPFGLPSAPTGLTALGSDRTVALSWQPPASDGGRPVVGYRIHFGESEGELKFSRRVENTTSFDHTALTNGATYCYAVSAVTAGGEGPRSTVVTATPMSVPGVPTRFFVGSVVGGVELTWLLPSDWGGATEVSLRVLRGTSADALQPLAEQVGMERYVDTAVLGGLTYHYQVLAFNSYGDGPPTAVLSTKVVTLPGTVTDLAARAGDRYVLLTWTAPADDGGTPVTGYAVMRGGPGGPLVEIARLGTETGFNDTMLENLNKYRYSVLAVNALGDGPASAVVQAVPMAIPGAPLDLHARFSSGAVILTWSPPLTPGMAPIVGYIVLRGPSADGLRPLVDVGPVLSYTDAAVERGSTYYYAVVACCELGNGTESVAVMVDLVGQADEGSPVPLLLVLAIVLIIVLGVGFAYGRRRAAGAGAGTAAATEVVPTTVAPSGGGVSALATPAPLIVEGPADYIVEEVLVVYRDGRLIADCSKADCRTKDADLMSGMLIAVQGLIQDGLSAGGVLESIRYGERIILLVGGPCVNLAAVVRGRPDSELRERLEGMVQSIETTYAGVIEQWTGDLSAMAGVDRLVTPLFELSGREVSERLEPLAGPSGVSLLSAVDFHRGFVRLKVTALNSTGGLITDAALEVRYDPEMLRLESVEPERFRLVGDRVVLGSIRPDESRAVAILFDPLMCQETFVDGALSYYDPKGEFRSVDMRRRQAEVVCPAFFTRDHINTAILRKLVRDEFHESDNRVFRYPKALSPEEVLRLGKLAVGGGDLQLVREYIEAGPPYRAEVWYYGKTRVKGNEMVMRLVVDQERGVLEFFAASTQMQLITGLLAEYRKELRRLLREQYYGRNDLAMEQEDALRGEMLRRRLLLDRVEEDWEDKGGEKEADAGGAGEGMSGSDDVGLDGGEGRDAVAGPPAR